MPKYMVLPYKPKSIRNLNDFVEQLAKDIKNINDLIGKYH